MTAERDIEIYQGVDYTHTVTCVDSDDDPVTLTGTFAAEVRRYRDADSEVLATFTVDATQKASGMLVLSLAEAATADRFGGWWDLVETIGSATRVLLCGEAVCRQAGDAVESDETTVTFVDGDATTITFSGSSQPIPHAASHTDGGSDEISITGEQITSGTVADARIASTIARDTEVTAAVSAHAGATDPHGDRAYTDTQVDGRVAVAGDTMTGELVATRSNGGDPALGVRQANDSDDRWHVHADGTHEWGPGLDADPRVALSYDGGVTMTFGGSVHSPGDVVLEVEGDLTVTDDITATGQVKSAGTDLRVAAFLSSHMPGSGGFFLLETMPRASATASAITGSLTSGVLHLVAVWLPAGLRTYGVAFLSGATALSAGSNQWACLLDASRATLKTSTDLTSTAWGSNSSQTFSWTEYAIPADGWYHFGLNVTASTVPTLRGANPGTVVTGFGSASGLPTISGTSSTGLTNPASLPNPAAAVTATAGIPLAGLICAHAA